MTLFEYLAIAFTLVLSAAAMRLEFRPRILGFMQVSPDTLRS
jgi:hypothetical protein